MRVCRRIVLLLIIAVVSLADGQVALKTRARGSKHVQVVPKVEIISTIPRNETGRYGLGDIALLDNGESWAVGYDGEHTDRVYHSTGAGKVWQSVVVPGNGFTFKAVTFVDSQHGWAVGGNGLLIRTTNGGKSWKLLKAPTSSELHSVHFFNSRIGYVAGREGVRNPITDEVKGSVEILCTKDGGGTWRRSYKEDEPGSVFQIIPFSESGAFVVLDGNRLLRTEDQGETWQQVELSAKHVSAVALAPNGIDWLVGRNGVFQHSDNRGRTWQQAEPPKGETRSMNWWAITFSSNGTGLAVGDGGLLAITLNNGKTWQLQETGIQDDLRVVRLRGPHAIILGAKKAYSISVSSTGQRDGQ